MWFVAAGVLARQPALWAGSPCARHVRLNDSFAMPEVKVEVGTHSVVCGRGRPRPPTSVVGRIALRPARPPQSSLRGDRTREGV